MQRPQLTHDATLKWTLWQKLWEDAQHRNTTFFSGSEEKTRVDLTVERYVRRLAIPMVQNYLPRKVYEPCCLSGSCSQAGQPLHASLHPGRASVHLTSSTRDELVCCLAHSCATVGQPVQLLVRQYRSYPTEMRNQHQGLHCLFRHLVLESVEWHNPVDAGDAQEILRELTAALLLGSQPSLTRLRLVRFVTATAEDLATFVHALADGPHSGHGVTAPFVELTLAECAPASLPLRPVAAYVTSSSAGTLKRLSLYGNTQIAAEEWAVLGTAVARNSGLHELDVRECCWGDSVLAVFLASLGNFAPRPRFELNLSTNGLSAQCFTILANAPATFKNCATRLYLGETHLHGSGDEAISTMFEAFTGLSGISLRASTLSNAGLSRVLRALGESSLASRQWEYIDLSGVLLGAGAIKKIVQVHFAADAHLLLGSIDMKDQLAKANIGACLGTLVELDLGFCSFPEDGISRIAAALEKCAPVPLKRLRLDKSFPSKKSVEGGFPFLCKALRAGCSPALEVLHLAGNHLPVRSMVALLEQVSPKLKELNVAHSSVADEPQDRVAVLNAVMRRQKGGKSSFTFLDLYCVPSVAGQWIGVREVMDWLKGGQTAIRLITTPDGMCTWVL